jgi:hypothetical protein
LNYQNLFFIKSKVDMKLPFAMHLMTPYMAQINFSQIPTKFKD